MARKTTKVRGQALAVEGLTPLLRALKHVGDEAPKFVKAELRDIGNSVRDRAKANVEHRTGRHGDPGLPPLANTIRTSVTQRAVAIYSNQPYADVQNFGGRVGNTAIVPRASASAYMTKGVRQSQAEVADAIVEVGRKIERAYGRNG